jgi:hypothetical protein
LRPLGLGSIQSLVDPIVSSWRPTTASGRPKAARYAVTPSTASHRGRRASTRLRSSRPPSTNSALVSSATPTVGRRTRLVRPSPRDSSSCASCGPRRRGVNPDSYSAGHQRSLGVANGAWAAAEESPGLAPQNSTPRSSATTSARRTRRAASSSAGENRLARAATALPGIIRTSRRNIARASTVASPAAEVAATLTASRGVCPPFAVATGPWPARRPGSVASLPAGG